MRKFIYPILTILLTLNSVFLTSCDYTTYPYEIYDNVKWTTSDFDVWFTVQNHRMRGEIKIDDKIIEIGVYFDPIDVEISPTSSNSANDIIFTGMWRLNRSCGMITVTEINDRQGVLGGVTSMTFVMEDL
jgi:hypothetical protein